MILCVGNINFDILMVTDRLPQPHEKMICPDARLGPGGSAANTAHWLGRLKVPVALAGRVGRDALGRHQLEALRRAGVDTSPVRVVNAPTGVAVVFSMGEEKRMVKAPGANLAGNGKSVADSLPESAKLVYLSGDDPAFLSAWAEAAVRAGIGVVLGGRAAAEDRLLAAAAGAILNHDELTAVTGVDDPDEALRALDLKWAAVTLPEGGCVVSEGVRVSAVPAPRLEPVDRTGGGDAFAAGFLAAVHAGLPPVVGGRWGNRLAGGVIMAAGARPDIPLTEFDKNNNTI